MWTANRALNNETPKIGKEKQDAAAVPALLAAGGPALCRNSRKM